MLFGIEDLKSEKITVVVFGNRERLCNLHTPWNFRPYAARVAKNLRDSRMKVDGRVFWTKRLYYREIWPRDIYGKNHPGKSPRAHVYEIETYAMHVAPWIPLLKLVGESAFSRCQINVTSAAIAKRNTYLISGVLLSIDTQRGITGFLSVRRAGGIKLEFTNLASWERQT